MKDNYCESLMTLIQNPIEPYEGLIIEEDDISPYFIDASSGRTAMIMQRNEKTKGVGDENGHKAKE